MFERFTSSARRVLVLAQEEARLLNHNFMGTEHLLLGLLHEGDGVAAQALERSGITLEGARSEVEATIGVAADLPGGSPPFTPRAKKVLELSLRESMQMGQGHIGTEHLLLGLIREGEGVASTVILSLGVGLGELRQEVIDLMSETGNDEPGIQEPRPREEPPQCPRCGAGLAEEGRYRVLDVRHHDSEAGEPTLSIPVIFCNRCSRALGGFDIGRSDT
jgi:ATP-dependent Clp protease ATP-binding subunit ClpC